MPDSPVLTLITSETSEMKIFPSPICPSSLVFAAATIASTTFFWFDFSVTAVTKTLGTVSPDKSAVMFKIAVHNEGALHSFLDGSNPVSKPIFDEVMESYEIFEINKV